MVDGSYVTLNKDAIIKYLMWFYFYSQADFRAKITKNVIKVIPKDAVHLGYKTLSNNLRFAYRQILILFDAKDNLDVKKYRKLNIYNV